MLVLLNYPIMRGAGTMSRRRQWQLSIYYLNNLQDCQSYPMNRVEEEKQFEILTVNRYEVEENAVFLDYDTAKLLEFIDKYSEMKFHLRLSLAKNLKSVEQALADHPQQFASLMEKLSKDHEDMENELLRYLKGKRPFPTHPLNLKASLLQPLMNMASGSFLQIKQESCHLISQLAHNFQASQLEEILEFAHNMAKSDNEENKIVAIQLMAGLACDLPNAKREEIFLSQFQGIYTGSSVRVKKEIILELGKLAANLSPAFVDNQIVRVFFAREAKENAWGIRKACVEIITQLLVRVKESKQELCNILLTLLKDGNKFVRIASHKIIPEFVAKYGEPAIPQPIFDVYLSLADLDINNQVSQPHEITEKISYYFPGVLETVGSSMWVKLFPLFHKLLHNRNENVKKPLADSLHEISRIIGPDHSKQYLFSSLDYILREPTDSIKLCAIRNLSKFVAQFETQTKQNLIDVFLVLQKDPKKWRVRYLISNQLQFLSDLYDAETVFKYIFPISLKLCNDMVSEVRMTAASQIVYVINRLKSEENLHQMAVDSIIGYAASQKYLQRQTFCLMIESLFDRSQFFYKNYSQSIAQLSKDPVTVVKIALSISLSNILRQHPEEKQRLKTYIEALSQDPEVEQYFQGLDLGAEKGLSN